MADSAYPARSNMLVLYKRSRAATPDEARKRRRFNLLCSSGRVIVESTIGTMKARLPYVFDAMRQRKLANAAKIITACVCIHNFLVKTGSGYLEVDEPPEGWDLDV